VHETFVGFLGSIFSDEADGSIFKENYEYDHIDEHG